MIKRPRLFSIVIVSFLVLVSALLFLSFFSPLNMSIFSSEKSDSQTVVYITHDGLSEKEITIPVGGTVTWINTDTNAHWPASDFHPTHTMYSKSGIEKCGTTDESVIFDACKGILQGEKYSFTFMSVGSWTYHDHLFPSFLGVVHVVSREDSFQSIKKEVLPSSTPTPEKFRTLKGDVQAEILETMSKEDPKTGWEYLKEAFVVNGEVVSEAHTLAHIIGNNIYKKNSFVGIGICDPTFAYGCYHGVTEQFLLNEGPEKIRETMGMCRDIFPSKLQKNELPYYSCIHGIGHGLLTWNNLVLEKALYDCDRLDEQERSYCYDGVFMEFSSSAPQNSFDTQNLWSVCTDLNEKYAMGCARYLPSMLQGKFLMTQDDTITFCKSAPTKTLRDGCTDNFAFSLAYTGNDTINVIESTCKKIDTEEYQSRCITTAAGELVFQGYQDSKENANKLCDSLSNKWQVECHESVRNIEQSH